MEKVAIALVLVAVGKATAYGPDTMNRVVENRVGWGQLDLSQSHVGYVALADEKYLNSRVLLELPTGEIVGPFLVADCGAEHDQEHLNEIGFGVDLSYELAEKYLEDPRTPLHGVKVWLIEENADIRIQMQ